MEVIEQPTLDCFLELPLVASVFLETNQTFTCIHDDNGGNPDQRIHITLRNDASDSEVLHVHTPVDPGLRFRNHCGGGMSLPVHNALKILAYASGINEQRLLPGLERDMSILDTIITDMLEGVIVLPAEMFTSRRHHRHRYFEITKHFIVCISVDGDTHIITTPNTEANQLIHGDTTFWNPEPFVFCLESNCSRAVYNALILLALAVKECEV